MRLVVCAVAAVLALTVAHAGGAQTRPTLLVLDRAPFTVRGTAFRPAERVTVTVASNGPAHSRRVTTTAAGRFRTAFADVSIGPCDFYVVRAVGNRGSRATLRVIPECAQP